MRFLEHRRRAPGWGLIKTMIGWDPWRGACGWFFRIFYRVRRFHVERLPRTGPLIVVSNHQSHYDPPFVGSCLPDRPTGFLARGTLFAWKPFGALIRFFGSVPVDPKKGAKEGIRVAIAELEAGRCMLLFPEGTRTADGSIGPFKGGFGLLVRRTGATIVPVAIDGLRDVWPKGRSRPRLGGEIGLLCGEPIPAEQYLAMDAEAGLAFLRSTVVGLRVELRATMGWPPLAEPEAPDVVGDEGVSRS